LNSVHEQPLINLFGAERGQPRKSYHMVLAEPVVPISEKRTGCSFRLTPTAHRSIAIIRQRPGAAWSGTLVGACAVVRIPRLLQHGPIRASRTTKAFAAISLSNRAVLAYETYEALA